MHDVTEFAFFFLYFPRNHVTLFATESAVIEFVKMLVMCSREHLFIELYMPN